MSVVVTEVSDDNQKTNPNQVIKVIQTDNNYLGYNKNELVFNYTLKDGFLDGPYWITTADSYHEEGYIRGGLLKPDYTKGMDRTEISNR